MGIEQHRGFQAIEAERVRIFETLRVEQLKRARPLQCILTPLADADGSTKKPFAVDRAAGGEGEDWRALGIETKAATGTRCQYYCHRYAGPQGTGFILGCRVVYQKQVFIYEEHFGAEDRAGPFDQWFVMERD